MASRPTANDTLTAVPGITVGHAEMSGRPTGCTAILTVADAADAVSAVGATAGVDVRGGAPGSRETDLLDPTTTVDTVHGIVLAGGSAFGLAAADGVVRALADRGIGYPTPAARVPIVPAAILYDLTVGDRPDITPDADCGRRAAMRALDAKRGSQPVVEGTVGAGAGASVGKLAGPTRAMRGGIGSASITLPDGVVIGALIAVNALGDIVDPETGQIVAGMRDDSGPGLATGLTDVRRLMRAPAPLASGRDAMEPDGQRSDGPQAGTNTTIGVVATNVELTVAQATKVAQMAQDGLARAIVPAHTPFDGDTIFCLATGHYDGPPTPIDPAALLRLGALAADATSVAILRAVRAATGLPGLPATRDLR